MSLRSLLGRIPIIGPRFDRLRQSRPDNCVQTVVAMALGVPAEVVERRAGTAGTLTVSATIDLLREIGIPLKPVSAELVADFWPAYYRMCGGRRMRGLGWRLPRPGERVGHAFLVVGPRLYDPATGELKRLDERTLRGIDWLALLPEDLYDDRKLDEIRAALLAG